MHTMKSALLLLGFSSKNWVITKIFALLARIFLIFERRKIGVEVPQNAIQAPKFTITSQQLVRNKNLGFHSTQDKKKAPKALEPIQ